MAKPIKETPVLKGKDATRFLKQIKENETQKVSKEAITRMKKNFSILNSIAKF